MWRAVTLEQAWRIQARPSHRVSSVISHARFGEALPGELMKIAEHPEDLVVVRSMWNKVIRPDGFLCDGRRRMQDPSFSIWPTLDVFAGTLSPSRRQMRKLRGTDRSSVFLQRAVTFDSRNGQIAQPKQLADVNMILISTRCSRLTLVER